MAAIDPEILYLVLTKVARKEEFYGFNAGSGWISAKDLGGVYERITGRTVGTRVNWKTHLAQLDLLLSHCGLPALSKVVGLDQAPEPLAESLVKVHSAQWPAFSALKNLYRK